MPTALDLVATFETTYRDFVVARQNGIGVATEAFAKAQDAEMALLESDDPIADEYVRTSMLARSEEIRKEIEG